MGPRLLAADLGAGVAAGFTTRIGGASAAPYAENNLGMGVGDDARVVAANRAGVEEYLGASLVWSRPVHGAQVALVDGDAVRVIGGEPGEAGGAPSSPSVPRDQPEFGDLLDAAAPPVDALVTAGPGRGVAVLAADCVPVLLSAHAQGTAVAVAAVHAGRRGVVAGVVSHAVTALSAVVSASGAAGPHRLRGVVGPAICGRCYEVPAEMREEVAAQVPQAWSATAWGTPGLDLPRAVAAQLVAAGVEVATRSECTREVGWLYSHRRDGLTGRFAGVAALRHAGD